MTKTERLIAQQTLELRDLIGADLTWRYEERFDAMLSEFAQNRGGPVLQTLQTYFVHEWDYKSIKSAPPELIKALGDLAKLSKNQKLLTIPNSDDGPAMIATWWPWGHGGTYSLRLKVIPDSYDMENIQTSFIERLKAFFK